VSDQNWDELRLLLGDRCNAVARRWQRALAGTSYVPLSAREILNHLLTLTERLIAILLTDPFTPAAAREVGAALVQLHFTQAESLGHSVEILGVHLIADLPTPQQHGLLPRISAVLGEMATGFTAAMRANVLAEQESIRSAVIVAQQQAEEALRDSEARFHGVFAEAAVGIGIGDMSGRILEANQALQTMFGYSLDEFRQLNVSDFVHPEDAASVWESYGELIGGTRDHFRLEKRFFRRNHDVMWTRLTVSLVRDAAGAPAFQIAMLEDITESTRAQAELEAARDAADAANRAKSDFLANMSHELRTPLHAIIGFTELLQDNLVTDEEERAQSFADIHASAQHLLSLINDVLDLSKIEAGRMELDYELVDVPELFAAMLALLRERAGNKRLTMTANAGDVTTIAADARKLKQILFNLLANAIKFTNAGGAVTLEARAVGSDVVLSVADTGIGISEEDQRELFRTFTQVDASLARRHEGTGLGLALTRRLVELHGGQITVRSAPGEGSIFTVLLPQDGLDASKRGPNPDREAVMILRQ
jgi:PAS domain S-box-containing protein